MNQGKLEVVKQKMARVNTDILGISKLSGLEWANLIQITIISTTVDKNGEGNGYPLQYSCLETPMDRGAR